MTNSSGTNLDRKAGRAAVDSTDGVHNLTRINRTGELQVIPARDDRLSISVPIQIKRRGGRKLVTLPSGEIGGSRPWDSDPTPLQLALARGHRWLAMLDSGSEVAEGARPEGGRGQQLRGPDG